MSVCASVRRELVRVARTARPWVVADMDSTLIRRMLVSGLTLMLLQQEAGGDSMVRARREVAGRDERRRAQAVPTALLAQITPKLRDRVMLSVGDEAAIYMPVTQRGGGLDFVSTRPT